MTAYMPVGDSGKPHIKLSEYVAEPTTLDGIQHYLDTEQMEKPIIFQKTDKFISYFCCLAWTSAFASVGMTCACPVSLCCPSKITDQYMLKLDEDSVVLHSAQNDCCCHVASSMQTVPLDKIQDVQLQEGCCETCFSLKKVQIETAGQGGPGGPEVVAAFLQSPEKAREAIQTAVKLCKTRGMSPPGVQGGMSRAAGGNTMADRLTRLNMLVQRGVLTPEQQDRIKVGVLTAQVDPMLRLMEAEDVRSKGLINDKEFGMIRDALVAQVLAPQA